MAIGKADGDEIRRIVEDHIQKKLGPIATELNRLSTLLVRLYNSNGGHPGFLQTARAEDKEKLDAVFASQGRVIERLDVVEDYVETQKIVRAELEKADEMKAAEIKATLEAANLKVNNRISKQNILIALAALLISFFMAWVALKEYQHHALLRQPAEVNAPQDSGTTPH